MFTSVFVTRTTFTYYVRVFPADIGIVKKVGCVYFASALDYRENAGYGCPSEQISLIECEAKYDSVPERGEAWLVEEGRKYIHWTRVDHNMHLLDNKGDIIKGNKKED